MKDRDVLFHKKWLGLAQPIEGLVFSVPALADAQIAPEERPELSAAFEAQLDGDSPRIRSLESFFRSYLGYAQPGMLVPRAELPADLSFYAAEGGQEIRPSFALGRGPFASEDPFAAFDDAPQPAPSPSLPAAKPWFALLWDLTGAGADLDLDEPESVTGPWRYSPTAKLERLLRHVGIPIGLLADVTEELAKQVFEAVEILVAGFEAAVARDCVGGKLDWLRPAIEAGGDHFYQGVLSVVLRLVFLLYAEDQALLPVEHRTYVEHLSLGGLYARLSHDAGAHPESMHHRFGAYGQLLALFRAVFFGVKHGTLELPPRRGRLFDPNTYPFLEGGLPGWTAAVTDPAARTEARPPSLDDGTVYRVMHAWSSSRGSGSATARSMSSRSGASTSR